MLAAAPRVAPEPPCGKKRRTGYSWVRLRRNPPINWVKKKNNSFALSSRCGLITSFIIYPEGKKTYISDVSMDQWGEADTLMLEFSYAESNTKRIPAKIIESTWLYFPLA